MAQSRVEKFKEYRKSIISDGSVLTKDIIDTTLKTSTSETKNINLIKEAGFANEIVAKKWIVNSLFIIFVIAIITLLIVFGVKYF